MPGLYKKKLIKFGSSFGIILPQEWLRYWDLQQGDSVRMVTDHDIKISPILEKESPSSKAS